MPPLKKTRPVSILDGPEYEFMSIEVKISEQDLGEEMTTIARKGWEFVPPLVPTKTTIVDAHGDGFAQDLVIVLFRRRVRRAGKVVIEK